MKIAATGNGYRAVSFGRALHKDEINSAYSTALEARKLMGAEQGNGVLFINSDRFPQANETGLKEQLNGFFDTLKKLLGINTVEVGGVSDDALDESINSALSKQGLKRMVKLDVPTDLKELEKTVEEAAKNADGLRVMSNSDTFTSEHIKVIEDTFKKVKGENFDPRMIIYEHGEKAYDWNNSSISKLYDGKTIVTSSNNLNDNNGLWGSKSFVTDRMKAKQGEFIHGLRNSYDADDFAAQINNERQIREAHHLLESELKLYDDEITHPARFAAAKRGDVVLSNNFYKYYNDIIPGIDANISGFEKAYNEALQNGMGDNYFDSLAKAMKALGLDQSSPEVYENVCKYRNALYAPGAKSFEELAQVSAQAIEASYKDNSNVVLQGVEIKKAALEAAKAEAEQKAAREAKNIADLKEFVEFQENAAKEAAKSRKDMNLLDVDKFDKMLNFVRAHKNKFIIGGIITGLLVIGGTMYSYGKEVAEKTENGRPKPDNIK